MGGWGHCHWRYRPLRHVIAARRRGPYSRLVCVSCGRLGVSVFARVARAGVGWGLKACTTPPLYKAEAEKPTSCRRGASHKPKLRPCDATGVRETGQCSLPTGVSPSLLWALWPTLPLSHCQPCFPQGSYLQATPERRQPVYTCQQQRRERSGRRHGKSICVSGRQEGRKATAAATIVVRFHKGC